MQCVIYPFPYRVEEDGGPRQPRELWLIIDGSGSMGGAPEVQARDAASFFVKDLPQNNGAPARVF